MNPRPFIFDFDLPELRAIISSIGEPEYRALQIWQGLYRSFWLKPEEFTTLSKDLRGELDDHFIFSHLHPAKVQNSSDGETQKTLFRLPDGFGIETVRMRYERRRTLCLSTQAGCALGCVFCATGQMGFQRNITSGEIVEQVIHYAKMLEQRGERVTNIVMMGMGEPFHNYDATMQAIERLNHPEGMNMGARRFTISTVGLVPAIRRFTAEDRQVNLAVSLHAVDDDLRTSMMPINIKYPVNELLQACWEYTRKTRRRITFEWALIRNVNDTIEQAEKLGRLLQGMLCHVNVIPLNPTDGYDGQATSAESAQAFQSELRRSGIPCTVRLRRGIDIRAGCGQLANAQKSGD
jgi:23S rRNA (adenine2503-C2)-methyltransferase